MKNFLIFFLLLILAACSPSAFQAKFIEPFPRVDTKDQVIEYQPRQKVLFQDQSISFDNQFDAARMNACWRYNDSTYSVLISPENYPINASPWFAFRIISETRRTIWIQLNYKLARHRYVPKISQDRSSWTLIQKEDMQFSRGDSTVLFPVQLRSDTTWVSAQEIYSSADTHRWAAQLATAPFAEMSGYGQSRLGRPLNYLDIGIGKKKKKPILVVFGRQHPPEITGFLAMKAFMETIMDQSELSTQFLKKYQVLFYPILNPDGVDLGHWRHNAGGVDLNRDWGSYNQSEIRQICDHIVSQAAKHNSSVVMGIDFHSTQFDIFYTNSITKSQFSQNVETNPYIDKNITKIWLSKLDAALDETLEIEPSSTRPVATSKNWFYEELMADGVTYEVGDEIPRSYIHEKATLSARILMEILLNL